MPRLKKSPAYQWYPRDYMADALVVSMTLEQEGAYRRLMDVCWLEQGLPIDLAELWRLAKAPSRERFERFIWNVVGRKFQTRRGKFQHKRLDRERAKQAKNRRKKQLAANSRWRKEGSTRNADASRVQCPSSSSSSTSSSADRSRSARGKVFVGARLVVSSKQHGCVVAELGADAGYIDWMGLYPIWDQRLVESNEPFDTLAFLKQQAQAQVRAMRRGGALFRDQQDDADWYEECQRLHGGTCNGSRGHANLIAIEAHRGAKAAV